jgi:hypothetical protein
VGIIVLLATAISANDAQLVAYVGFAATLSSLLLAVLAIIYSMTSNAGLNATLLAIHESSGELADRARDIAGMSKVISDIPGQFDELKKTYAAPTTGQPTADVETQSKEEFVESFLGSGSNYGLMTIYAGCCAAESGRKLVLGELAGVTDTGISNDYALGYLVATSSAGLFELSGGKEGRTVKVLIDGLKEKVLEEEADRYERDKSKYGRLQSAFDAIKAHFGEDRTA